MKLEIKALTSKEHFVLTQQLESDLNAFWAEFHIIAFDVQRMWRTAINKSKAPARHKAGYIQEVQVIEKSDNKWIIQSEGEFTDLVEVGHAPWDLKKGLLRSKSARRSKDGSLYTIVPFRHYAKDLSAAGIYEDVSAIDKDHESLVGTMKTVVSKRYREVGHRQEENAFGQTVKRAIYSKNPARYNKKSRVPKKQKKFQGIVKTGSKKQTGYMTFRIVSSKSPESSWIHPGYKGQNIFSSISGKIESMVKRKLQTALMKDIAMGGRDTMEIVR